MHLYVTHPYLLFQQKDAQRSNGEVKEEAKDTLKTQWMLSGFLLAQVTSLDASVIFIKTFFSLKPVTPDH